jgi:hypothetical protein
LEDGTSDGSDGFNASRRLATPSASHETNSASARIAIAVTEERVHIMSRVAAQFHNARQFLRSRITAERRLAGAVGDGTDGRRSTTVMMSFAIVVRDDVTAVVACYRQEQESEGDVAGHATGWRSWNIYVHVVSVQWHGPSRPFQMLR